MNTRKFKAPFDLCGGKIPKGTEAYMALQDVKGRFYCISAQDCSISLPAEIVEQWEEVFDEQPKIEIDDIVVGKTVLINKNSKIEYLVIAKNQNIKYVSIADVWTSMDTVNLYYTIKQ